MSYFTTILGQMIQLISRLDFEHTVNRYQGDHRIRTFRCWDQFIFMLLAQFSRRESLRETVISINSLWSKLYHLGCSTVQRSTFSDANHKRSYHIYRDLFFILLERTQKIAPQHKLKLKRKLYFLDATTIDLCLKLFPWARFRKTKAGIKVHTLFQADGALPVFLNITDAKTHEAKVASSMPIPTGSYLAIDRGYHDFLQYNRYINNNIRFVTRMKTNAKYTVLQNLPCASGSPVRNDEMIEFTGYITHRKCPHPFRKICYYDEQHKKMITFLTNDFDNDALTITEIYQARWDIELFFKTIKQNLKIKRFFGTTPNAVFTQVWIAMIAYLLISFLKFIHKSKQSIQTIFRILQMNIFERRSINDLIKYQSIKPPPVKLENQFCFF